MCLKSGWNRAGCPLDTKNQPSVRDRSGDGEALQLKSIFHYLQESSPWFTKSSFSLSQKRKKRALQIMLINVGIQYPISSERFSLQLETVIRKAILLILWYSCQKCIMSLQSWDAVRYPNPRGHAIESRFFCWDGARSGKTEKPLETGGRLENITECSMGF